MKEDRGRVARGLDVPRCPSKHVRPCRNRTDRQRHEGEHRQSMGRAEAAVSKDSEGGHGRDQRRHQINLPAAIVRGDLLVADQRDESVDQGDQADRRMKQTECCEARHGSVLPQLTKSVMAGITAVGASSISQCPEPLIT